MTRRSGLSLVEVVAATAVLAVVLLAAGALVGTTADVAADTRTGDAAGRRASEVARVVARELRRASLATVQRPDATAFTDGTTDAGMSFRPVVGYAGVPLLGDRREIRLVRDAGAETGDVVLVEGPLTITVAREVAAFSVERAGDAFVVAVAARAGPANDRRHTAAATVTVAPRNP